jgi:hypothetical protein
LQPPLTAGSGRVTCESGRARFRRPSARAHPGPAPRAAARPARLAGGRDEPPVAVPAQRRAGLWRSAPADAPGRLPPFVGERGTALGADGTVRRALEDLLLYPATHRLLVLPLASSVAFGGEGPLLAVVAQARVRVLRSSPVGHLGDLPAFVGHSDARLRPGHRPHGALRRSLGQQRRLHLDRTTSRGLRQRPGPRGVARRGHRPLQPQQSRPGPSPVDAPGQRRPLPVHGRRTATKLRWNLATDDTELAALNDLATSCPDQTVTYAPAT